MAKVSKSFRYGNHDVTLETGEIARQASGAVLVSMGGTVVLVTAVAATKAREGQDFFPLTVDYQEKFYSAGRIPGGFFKREGRPTEKETLTSRLIDRPVRPLFPEEFKNEVQVIATVLSMNPEIDGDIPALIGASAALTLAGMPFKGPIGAARVGYANGQYLLNPTKTELATSDLDLVVAGTANAVLMVESEAKLLSEDVMLGAVTFGHREMQKAINAIGELAVEAGKPSWNWQPPARNDALVAALTSAIGNNLADAFQIRDKLQRRDAIAALKKDAFESLAATAEATGLGGGGSGEGVLGSGIQHAASGRAQDEAAHRRPQSRRHPPDHGARRRAAAHARLGAVHARRDTGARHRHARHHARLRRSSTRRKASRRIRSCSTTTSRRSRSAKPAAWPARSAARSAMVASPSAACRPSSRRWKRSRTCCAWSPRSPSRTVPRRWHRSAARRWR